MDSSSRPRTAWCSASAMVASLPRPPRPSASLAAAARENASSAPFMSLTAFNAAPRPTSDRACSGKSSSARRKLATAAGPSPVSRQAKPAPSQAFIWNSGARGAPLWAEPPVEPLGGLPLLQMPLPILDERALSQDGFRAIEIAARDMYHRRFEVNERKVGIEIDCARGRLEPLVPPGRMREPELVA